jgi:WD40 repeat protein
VNAICLSRDGMLAVTASSDRTIRSWDLLALRQRALLGRHRRQALALALDDQRGRAWSGGHDGVLSAWDVKSGSAAGTIDLGAPVAGLAVSPDGLVAAGMVGAGVSVRDQDGAEVVRLVTEADAATSLTWSADGSFLLAAIGGRAIMWEIDGWDVVRTIEPAGQGVWPIALGPDGRRIALGWHGHVGLWGPDEDGDAVAADGLPKGVYGLAFSHAGDRLAMAAADGRVRLWSVS